MTEEWVIIDKCLAQICKVKRVAVDLRLLLIKLYRSSFEEWLLTIMHDDAQLWSKIFIDKKEAEKEFKRRSKG